jgi:hypothetical protein
MNVGGRPPKFTDPEQLQNLVDEYFDTTDRPTLAGLAVHLGMSRSSLYNYAEKNGFLDIIKSAQARVEALYEERAVYDGQPTGVIFALKNMGWTDRLATDHTTKGEAITPPIKWRDDD